MKTSPLNLGLIILGTALVMIGAYRTFPVTIDRKFAWQNGPLAVAAVIILILAVAIGGIKFIKQGVDTTVATASSFLPTMVILIPVIGFSLPLAKHFEGLIAQALESRFGYGWALISSFVSPSGNIFAEVIKNLWSKSPGIRLVLLYLLTATPLISFTLYYARILGLGTEIAKTMYKVNCLIAVGLIPLFWVFGRFFYK